MKRDDKRPRSGRKKNLLKAIGVLAVGAGAGLAHLPAAQAYQVAISSGDEATLEQFLRDHPTSLFAADVIGRLSFGTPKADTAIEPPVVLAKNNGNGNGGGNGNNGGGNGNNGGGNGTNGGGGDGNNGGGGSGSDGGDSDGAGSDSGDSHGGENGQSNGGNGRFKGEGDTGRPDIFGDPGVPEIGPPGLSGY